MTSFLDYFYHIIIKFAHVNEIGIVTLIGFLFINRKVFGLTIFIVLFTMILNAYLKSIWQIPLNPSLNKVGWSFPSGHIQVSAVYWFLLSLLLKKPYMVITSAFLMFAICCGIIHFDYHNWPDAIAALSFAGIEIIVFHYIIRLLNYFKVKPYIFGMFLFSIEVFIVQCMLPPSSQGKWIYFTLNTHAIIIVAWFILDNVRVNKLITAALKKTTNL